MKTLVRTSVRLRALLCILANLIIACDVIAQLPLPFAPPTTPNSQRNTLNALRAQVNWFRNATHRAPNFITGNYEMVWQQFQQMRSAYNEFKATLTPNQLTAAANELAQLEAGLD